MALALRGASGLKPDIRLAQAVSEFEALLTSEQKVAFRASRTSATSTAPTMSDVMRLTAEMDMKATCKHGRVRCFGPRLTNILQAIQQFAALGDIVVGGSQNLIACGVWAAARMTIHVATGYLTHLEKLSLLFMAVGRNAPRYQAMAAIYPKSKNLQRYLCEYFIIITKVCHQTITWTQKSALSRLSSSISDPDMKSFQADLDTWSASIKEEANLLLSQCVHEEAKENAKFRLLTSYRSEYVHHRQRINQCIRFLDACSQHDYRTTWKQTRKRGTTRTLPSYNQYQQWKVNPQADNSILFRGKLGAGKSVLLANIIDDLNVEERTITLYFFARHDIPDSLSPRTIIGSLIRQLLENFVNNSAFDDIFVETISRLDLDDILDIFSKIPYHNQRVFIVLDGLDECSMEDQRTVLRCLSAIQSDGYKLCVSVRTPNEISIWQDQSFQYYETIPEENPDISDYVQVEVDDRVRDRRLITQDPWLLQDIKQELIERACGMFPWVSLQLDSICSEISDSAIREAIQNLPRDLTETYERNLIKANSNDSKGHHIRIFKLLVSARELLTTEQLREAVSVTVGQTDWRPDQHISNIHAALSFCGSLVMVDEEDDTVRFIHHSARSFCLNSPRNEAEWTFTEEEADIAMAETLVTYLSYNVFDTRVSRHVIPKINAKRMPQKVALSALSNQVGAGFTSKLLKLKSPMKHDIGPVLAEASGKHWKDNTKQFYLLPYAKDNWIPHTSHLESLPSVPQWQYLLDHPTFGIETGPSNLDLCFYIDSQSTFDHMDWALINGHILLLKHELTKDRGKRKIQALYSLLCRLRRILPQLIRHVLDYQLAKWLSIMLIRLRMKHPAKPHLLNRLSSFDNSYGDFIKEAMVNSDSEAVVLLLRDDLDPAVLSPIITELTEWAVSSANTSVLRLLIDRDLLNDPRTNAKLITRVLDPSLSDGVTVRLVYVLFHARINAVFLEVDVLYLTIKLLSDYTSLDQASLIVQRLFSLNSVLSLKAGPPILLNWASIFPDETPWLESAMGATNPGNCGSSNTATAVGVRFVLPLKGRVLRRRRLRLRVPAPSGR
ncbi:hypothetical protein F53441_888 [Fusarium austroafricanum]|uniref:NACHT domain-containing protein n=1 Tax=Fusarium austroafricanum TaxID=2364996 RepID=A0A8H4KVW9_9HYPO|nr:hypothetical protein F53441_888 [Fusarium austroafricanum]